MKLSASVYSAWVNGDPIAVCDNHKSAIGHRDTVIGIRGGRGWIEVFPRVGDLPAARCDLKDYLVAR